MVPDHPTIADTCHQLIFRSTHHLFTTCHCHPHQRERVVRRMEITRRHHRHPPRVLNHPREREPQVRAASLVLLAYGGIHSLTSWPPRDTQIPTPPSRYIHHLIHPTVRIRPRLISVTFICKRSPLPFPMKLRAFCQLTTRHSRGEIRQHIHH